MTIIKKSIFLNGVYDIICAASLLNIIHPFFTQFHLNMFYKRLDFDTLEIRLLAYWIATYGSIRIIGSYKIICISYCIEACVIMNETFIKKTIYLDKGFFVIFFSFLLAFYSYKIK
jgi:hypothetical protein